MHSPSGSMTSQSQRECNLGPGGPLGPVLSSRPLFRPPLASGLFWARLGSFIPSSPVHPPVRSVPPLLFCSLRSLPIFFPLPLDRYACFSSCPPPLFYLDTVARRPSLYIWVATRATPSFPVFLVVARVLIASPLVNPSCPAFSASTTRLISWHHVGKQSHHPPNLNASGCARLGSRAGTLASCRSGPRDHPRFRDCDRGRRHCGRQQLA